MSSSLKKIEQQQHRGEKNASPDGNPVDRSADHRHVAGSVPLPHIPGSEKREHLGDGVVDTVQERRKGAQAARRQTDRHDTDMLHTAVREEPLHVELD